MMCQWERKIYQSWPSRHPVWTLGALFGAVLFFMLACPWGPAPGCTISRWWLRERLSWRTRQVKNIQIIDGANNCTYSIYAVPDMTFDLLFPQEGQDIEFIKDFIARLGSARAGELLAPIWEHRVDKRGVAGIHGTLFFDLSHKREFCPNKRETDFDDPTIQRSRLIAGRLSSARSRRSK